MKRSNEIFGIYKGDWKISKGWNLREIFERTANLRKLRIQVRAEVALIRFLRNRRVHDVPLHALRVKVRQGLCRRIINPTSPASDRLTAPDCRKRYASYLIASAPPPEFFVFRPRY